MFKSIIAIVLTMLVTGCALQPWTPADQARLDKEWGGKRNCPQMMHCYDVQWETRMSTTIMDYN